MHLHIDAETILAIGLVSNVVIEVVKVFVTKPALDAKLDELGTVLTNAAARIASTGTAPKT